MAEVTQRKRRRKSGMTERFWSYLLRRILTETVQDAQLLRCVQNVYGSDKSASHMIYNHVSPGAVCTCAVCSRKHASDTSGISPLADI